MMRRIRRAGRLGLLRLHDLTNAFASVKWAGRRAAAVELMEDGLARLGCQRPEEAAVTLQCEEGP
eukprot:7220234-Pyramimonas_sp.AAC.1